jgi:hypothetical protein
MSQAKWQRARWVLMGVLIGAALTVVTWVGLSLVFASNDIDAIDIDDATEVADRWAIRHRRATESYVGHDCAMDAGGYRFVCHVRFEPTDRRFTLFMRKIAEGGDYAVVIAHVQKGNHPLPDFPNTVKVPQ